MPSIQRAEHIEPGGCPGSAEYGRGLSRTTVHAGGCCGEWEALPRDGKVEKLKALGYLPVEAERRAGRAH